MVGLDWQKSVLHIHTPASMDYKGDLSITADEFIEKIIENNINVIGITDHNSFDWIEDLRKAAFKICKQTEKNLIIFPGIEIHTSDSVHILILFEPNTEISELERFLGTFGFKEEDKGNHDHQTNISLESEELFKRVKEFNGIIIFPHVKNKKKGLVEACKGHGIKQKIIDKKKHIFECSRNKIKDLSGIYNGPIIAKSDLHDIDEIIKSENWTWIKLSEDPDLSSLKQCIYDPKFRISIQEPKIPEYCYIESLFVSSNYYKFSEIKFNPQLNVFVGGRGAGKSLIIEIIAYILAKYPKSDPNFYNNFIRKLNKYLSEGINLSLNFKDQNNVYRISRIFKTFDEKGWSIENIENKLKEYNNQNPINFQKLVEDDWISVQEEDWSKYLRVDLFTQTCVMDIIKKGENLIELIDSFGFTFNRHKELFSCLLEKENLESEIDDIEKNIITLYSEITNPEEIKSVIDELNKDIKDLEAKLENEIFKKSIIWKKQDEKIKAIINFLDLLKTKFIDYDQIPDLEIIPNFQEFNFDNILNKVKEINKDILSLNLSQSAIKSKIENLIDFLNQKWKEKYQCIKDQISSEGDFASTESQYRNIIESKTEEIEKFKKKLLDNQQIKEQINDKEKQRTLLIHKLSEISKKIHDIRKSICEHLSSKMKGIKINLVRNPKDMKIYDLITNIMKREKISYKYEIIENLIDTLTPQEIFNIMTVEDTDKKIQNKLKELELSEKILKHFKKYPFLEWENSVLKMINNKEILELERQFPDDLVEIEYNKKGEWKLFEDLSIGEKCAILLNILLINDRKAFIIDQPEDELDYNSKKDLIEHLQDIKSKRQIILVTHFQNIPVLADAELIFKFDEKDKKSVIEKRGCFEEMIDVILQMEGGPEAFRLRYEKYSEKLD